MPLLFLCFGFAAAYRWSFTVE